jgi:hypothetical protein
VHRDGVIVGVNTGFHEAPFCRVRSARPPTVGEKSLTPKGVSYSRVARSRAILYHTRTVKFFQIAHENGERENCQSGS